ncbi:Hsp20/alpha crystallin family protein [Actinophytocola oryzae]|uniref:Heat shock protein Hsp20 n=1 Tax=Actinophytocola oryzae TaxID=502181 RepID=A0A4R7V1W2_9PSEU|nr:Hsp20/alpha crystallin family protein [Actinophytocola oryzae]TDV42537.1 heat shock protein Hsp20 [Actinophytocola oryzae]
MTSLMPRSLILPDVVRLLEGWPFGDRHAVRIEDYREDGKYVLRAELPGMVPEKDIHIQVHGNELAIAAERAEEKHEKAHSELFYGKFARTVRLPAGTVPDEISATYDAGILEVVVPVKPETDTRQIEVSVTR